MSESNYVSLRDLLKAQPVHIPKFQNATPSFFTPSPEQSNSEESNEIVKADEEEEVNKETNKVEGEGEKVARKSHKGNKTKVKRIFLLKRDRRQQMKWKNMS
uniref:Uncharacterized protein LOC104221488 n=1 Tax=Nicotiana sylvestris TaxID=4096 RepID=A0A1U7W9D6_NICSY|nr:PREDICTED: uncharacterized protein LOC104221488 [Nicotiana sylvestris]